MIVGLVGGSLLWLAPAPGSAEPARGDPAARLSAAAAATEYWDLSAQLDSGHHIFARFFITNEGPGIHTAAGIGTLVQPDGAIVPFRWGRLKGKWTLSDDRRLIDIASLMLDMRRQPWRFDIDSDKRAIKIHLKFTHGTPVWQAGGPARHRFDVLDVAAPIEGTVWSAGQGEPVQSRGTVTVTHAWMDTAESELVQRQIEVIFPRAEGGVYLTDFRAPGGQSWGWMGLPGSGGRPDAAAIDARADDSVGGVQEYPLPRRLRFDAGSARLAVEVRRELLRVDPIEVVPQPFRFLLSMKMSPQRISATAECRLTRGQPQVEVRGPCLTTVTYLNPDPR